MIVKIARILKLKEIIILSAIITVFLLAACSSNNSQEEYDTVVSENDRLRDEIDNLRNELSEINSGDKQADSSEGFTNSWQSVANLRLGEIITFGDYDWRVLDIQNSSALIISNNILDIQAYFLDWEYAETNGLTWADSDIRAYLNNELFNRFSQSDRERINTVTNQNKNNQWFDTEGGLDTQDNIFLLSLDEVVKYFGDSGLLSNGSQNRFLNEYWIDDQYNDNRIAYHIGGIYISMWDGVEETVSEGTPWEWWLRSPGWSSGDTAYIERDGGICLGVGDLDNQDFGVRPALWFTYG